MTHKIYLHSAILALCLMGSAAPIPGPEDAERAPLGAGPASAGPASAGPAVATDPMIEAVLHASRALVAVAARSLVAAGEEVTLPQYRALVVLASHGPQPAAALAVALGVNPSTATRMVDRLVRKKLVSRQEGPDDRRQILVRLTAGGQHLVDAVTERRRGEISRIVSSIPPERRIEVMQAMSAFAEAAGEMRDQDWSAGWSL